MAYYPHEDIPAVAPTSGAYDIIKDAARQARDFACGIRSQYPGAASVGTVVGSPAQQWKDAVWDNICRKSPAPPVEQPKKPYNGGQCVTDYNIQGYGVLKRDGTVLPFATTVSGKLGAFGITTPTGQSTIYQAYCIGTNSGTFTYPLSSSWAKADGNPYSSFVITSITRADGQPDNCGDPAPQYPGDGGGSPDPGELTKPYSPPSPTKPGSNWNIAIPFVYVNGKLQLNMDNKFNIKIDVGGVNFNFDLGGVEVNIGNNGGDGTPGSGSNPPPDLDGLGNKIDDAKKAADDAKKAADDASKKIDDRNKNKETDPQNDPNQQDKNEKGENDPKEEDAINRLLGVQVLLTSIPKNARQQDGADAPDVVYAGWFEFKTKGLAHPRQPIHFAGNYFLAPVGADGYAYTLYNGFKGRAIVVTAKAT